MTNEKMEQRLAAAVEKTAPNDANGVLSRCEERKGTVIPMTTKKTTKRRWTSLIAACLAVMLLGGGLFYQRANAVASVVSLDVNPSIELKVNRSEKVLVCTPLNEDAKAVLADMSNGADLKGAKLDVAVNAIVGSLVRNGYLDSISSAIMISVEDKDTARAEKLQRELTSAVDGVLQTSEAKAAVLTQTLTQDAAREQQARENSIFAIAVKVLVLIMTALPFFTVPMWIAIFADVGVCVIAVCNAMRALHSGRVGEAPPRKPAIAFPAQTENGEGDNKKIKM